LKTAALCGRDRVVLALHGFAVDLYLRFVVVRAIEKIKDDEDERRGPILCLMSRCIILRRWPMPMNRRCSAPIQKDWDVAVPALGLIDLRSAAMGLHLWAGLDAALANAVPFRKHYQCDGDDSISADSSLTMVFAVRAAALGNARRNACGCWRPWLAASRL